MSLTPGYGETPISEDEAESLVPEIREVLGSPVTKAAIYDLEQEVQKEVVENLLIAVLNGTHLLEDLLTDHFVRNLHQQLYGDIWTWAGIYRRRELNIGVAPEQISVELRNSLDNLRYRWQFTEEWTPREFGIAVHAETVRIHPFTDGNGRTTRLLADLTFFATQTAPNLDQYDWNLDKPQYIALLREYDSHRNPCMLAAFVPTCPFDE